MLHLQKKKLQRNQNADRISIQNETRTAVNSKKGIIIGLAGLLVFAVVLIGSWIAFYNYNLQPVGGSSENIIVNIPNDATIENVADILKDADLIRNAMVFQSYASRHSRGEKKIQAANYEFNQQMSVEEIFNKMLNGDAYLGEIRVTIPEGKNLQEIADILENKHVCMADDFIEECSDLTKYKAKYTMLNSIPDGKDRDLEGYLFPATYYWATDTPPATVAGEMVNAFVDYFDTSMQQRASEMGKTIDEIVIMGSIIELETKLSEDKANCASVFYNRIAAGMPLQSDITVDYALGSKHAVLTTDQTQVDSPYNTYINLGLPVGPICSPGLESMKAALYPATTNYYYFVADMDSGKLYFNETYEEHLVDVEKYM